LCCPPPEEEGRDKEKTPENLCQVELGYGLNYSIEDGQLVENKNPEEG